MQSLNNGILFCLSPAPSNRMIIQAAADMFRGGGDAKLIALFVETPDFVLLAQADKDRLKENMELARETGAEVVVITGENVPFQIAEYARSAGIRRIVMGQSILTGSRLLPRPDLSEQLLQYLPDVELHIIPDGKKKAKFRMQREEKTGLQRIWTDFAVCLIVLTAATLLGTLFDRLGFTDSNIMMPYLLGALLISLGTSNLGCSLASAAAAVLLFNYFFVAPRFSLQVLEPGYPVTFVVMFLTSLITGTLAGRLKKTAREAEQNAREKAEANQQYENERMRSTLLRSISHDLRTPLTAISGNANNLLSHDDSFDAETRRELYQSIYEDSLWLNNMVENMLASTRLEHRAASLQLSVEVVEDIIEETAEHVRSFSQGHKIVTKTPDEVLLVRADARLISQVLVNLVNNAINYTGEDKQIFVTMETEEDFVKISIRDTGKGISEENIHQIFEKYYRAEKTKREVVGTGLGLSIVRAVLKAHNF
ncbi:MAG: DUF4118 domain-containing protein, partial [Oscillospiraceae bacterium]|nr:DUF4118 domain-containing protein [Oscillospiraceae bacterium]